MAHLDCEHECDPLVVRCVWSIIFTLNPILVHNTPEVGLEEHHQVTEEGHGVHTHPVGLGDVGAPVYPTVVLGKVGTDTLELTAVKDTSVK